MIHDTKFSSNNLILIEKMIFNNPLISIESKVYKMVIITRKKLWWGLFLMYLKKNSNFFIQYLFFLNGERWKESFSNFVRSSLVTSFSLVAFFHSINPNLLFLLDSFFLKCLILFTVWFNVLFRFFTVVAQIKLAIEFSIPSFCKTSELPTAVSPKAVVFLDF